MLLHLNLAPNQSMYFYSLTLLLSTSLLRHQKLENNTSQLPFLTQKSSDVRIIFIWIWFLKYYITHQAWK